MDDAQRVGELYMKGYSDTQIANELDMKTGAVRQARRDWQELIRQEAETGVEVKDKVITVLQEVDKHWGMVIRESWETVEEAKQQGSLGSKNQALKLIASIQKDRASLFREVGADQDTELIERLNEAEYNQEILVELLRDIRDEHPEVAELISRRLSKIQSEVEVIEIESGGEDE